MLTAAKPKADVETSVPLVVDLDGTLIRSDLLVESVFGALANDPASAVALAKAALEGRAALQDCAATLSNVDVATLPYDTDVLELVEQARAEGRPVYLVSAGSARIAEAVADHIGLFDRWFATTRPADQYGEKVRGVAGPGASWRAWAKLLRVHQWAKNLLVFVPFAAAHAFHTGAAVNAVIAFVAFSLCASGVYILNDLFDLTADRAHPTKKNRPLANGTVPILQAIALAPALITIAFALAVLTNAVFVTILALYLALTTAYSVYLKRKLLLDAVSLATLYTLRVIGGAAAIAVPVSRWLLAFSLFIFMALALIKRYVELARLLDRGLPNPANRAYEKGDLPIVASLAAAAGYNAVIVLALYMSSDAVVGLYRSPEVLWLVCPLMMYWISRLLMKAHRRQMDDDPVVFALKDPLSLGVAATIAALGYIAL